VLPTENSRFSAIELGGGKAVSMHGRLLGLCFVGRCSSTSPVRLRVLAMAGLENARHPTHERWTGGFFGPSAPNIRRKAGPFWTLDGAARQRCTQVRTQSRADLPGNQVPLQPWAEALLKERMETSDTELIEFVCNVNEKDQPRLVGK
jgi:hypothetical protein